MKRRVLSLIMALVILLTMLPTSALAQEMETPAAGASVEATKGTPETTAPTTAPTVAVTASTKGSVPATEDSVLSTEGDIAPQNGEGSAVYSNGYVAEINGTPYEMSHWERQSLSKSLCSAMLQRTLLSTPQQLST